MEKIKKIIGKLKKQLLRGFTLVEMLATVVIVAILLMIAVPAINDIVEQAKIDAYSREIDIIEGVAHQYVVSNEQTLCDVEVTVQQLYDSGYLSEPVKDPRTGENIHPDSFVNITCVGDNQIINFYNILDDGEAPLINLVGLSSITLEKGIDTYNEEGATALDNLEGDLTSELQISNDVDENTVGVYVASYYVEDISGNSATVYRTINVVDTIAAESPTLSSSAVELVNTDLTISFLMNGDAVRSEYKIDNSSWIDYSGPITINNNAIVYARSYDGSDNMSEEVNISITNIDKVSPEVTITPNNSSLVNETIDVTIGSIDTFAGLDYYTYETSIDNGVTWSSLSSNLTTDITLTLDQTGLNLVRVNAFDLLGNTIEVYSGIYAIDVDLPDTPIIISSNTASTNENIVISVDYPDDGIINEIKIGGGSWNDYIGPTTISSNTSVYARTFDAAGNESLGATLLISNIDKTAPTTPVIVPSTTAWVNSDLTVSIEYSTDSDVKEYNINGGLWLAYSVPFTISDSGSEINARSYDLVGNVSNTSNLEIDNIDKEKPADPSYANSVTNITQTSVTLNWNDFSDGSSSSGYSKVRIYAQKYNGNAWENTVDINNDGSDEYYLDITGSDPKTYTVNGLDSGTQYRFIAGRHYDNASNAGNYTWQSVITIPEVPAAPSGTSGGLDWSQNEGRGYVSFSWPSVTGATGYKVWVYDGRSYRSFDVGNVTSWDSRVAKIYPTEAVVNSYGTNTRTEDIFNYSKTGLDLRDNPNQLYLGSSSSTYNSSTNYWFRVSSYNSSGSSAYSSSFTPTLPDRTDNTAPSTPTLTYSDTEGTNVTLNWAAFSDSESGYNFTRIHAQSYNGSTWVSDVNIDGSGGVEYSKDYTDQSLKSLTVDGLTPGTTYRFYVRYYDNVLNQSDSGWISVTPQRTLASELGGTPSGLNPNNYVSWAGKTWRALNSTQLIYNAQYGNTTPEYSYKFFTDFDLELNSSIGKLDDFIDKQSSCNPYCFSHYSNFLPLSDTDISATGGWDNTWLEDYDGGWTQLLGGYGRRILDASYNDFMSDSLDDSSDLFISIEIKNLVVTGGSGTSSNPYTLGPASDYDYTTEKMYWSSSSSGRGDYISYTVPSNGTYRIIAEGAAGSKKGGYSQGDFTLVAGDRLIMVVGNYAKSYPDDSKDLGGGGGTFVTKKVSSGGYEIFSGTYDGYKVTPLIVAGGGAGTVGGGTVNGSEGGGVSPDCDNSTSSYCGGGGGGFVTNGTSYYGYSGDSFLRGSESSAASSRCDYYDWGGFGGGGASCEDDGGGGGGWHGGDGDKSSGGDGGTSYNVGSNQVNQAGGATDYYGKITITKIN